MFSTLQTTLTKLLGTIVSSTSTSPSLGSIALVLVILFLSLKILGILYRTIIWWLSLAVRVGLVGGGILMAGWVYSRGPDGAVADVQYYGDYWMREYQKRKRLAQLASSNAGWMQ
jgi:hypothetical protein